MCERNVTPSSSISLIAASENTWKPPESVRIGRSHAANLCRPPARAITSRPGPQVQVIGVAEDDLASSGGARSSSAVIALTVPAVPTGMNTGVAMSPRGVCRMPARALPSVASSSNEKPGVGSRALRLSVGAPASRRRS